MALKTWSETLWGKNSKFIYLLLAATILLLAMLGGREIWTQEHRWADIVAGMFSRHDFLHPYLDGNDYYDKPLLSYWLIAGITYLTGQFSVWAMRLPSALAGILAIWSIYRIATLLKDKQLGLMSGWLLLTTYYFIFWAKTSSADMLNLGGTLFAVCWFFEKKDQPGFFNYAVFFVILALTALCKGLVGAVVPLMVLFPFLLTNNEWKKHLRLSLLFSIIPAAIIYALPFWASSHMNGSGYGENGLYLVYRENILRYFQPFDHEGPIYTYLIFLPVYLMPWALFFVPALFALKSRWQNMSSNAKNMCWAVLILFLFFTFSGSRRNYYVLPIVPFAILMTGEWILSKANALNTWVGRVAVIFFVTMFINFDIVQPLYYAQGGMRGFATQLKLNAGKVQPWSEWQFVMLDPESKTRFYLSLPPSVRNYGLLADQRKDLTTAKLAALWPVIQHKPENVIFVTRKMYEPLLKNVLSGYTIVEAPPSFGERILRSNNPNAPVAFIPPA
jgi:4-amino-4-deoxy-L-arabinose transferase-like glycosyltransferase